LETLHYSQESVVEKCLEGFSCLDLHFMLWNKQLYGGPFEGVFWGMMRAYHVPGAVLDRQRSVLKFPRLFAGIVLSPKNKILADFYINTSGFVADTCCGADMAFA
jgi:hypothetical protein